MASLFPNPFFFLRLFILITFTETRELEVDKQVPETSGLHADMWRGGASAGLILKSLCPCQLFLLSFAVRNMVPSVSIRLYRTKQKGEDLSDFTASTAERLEGDPLGSLGDIDGYLPDVHLEKSDDISLPTAFSEIDVDNIHGEIAEGESASSSEDIPSTWQGRTSPVEQATGITERIRGVGRIARENSQVTAIAIVGAAGATVLISRSSDSRGVGCVISMNQLLCKTCYV